jgi:hypothetical protein
VTNFWNTLDFILQSISAIAIGIFEWERSERVVSSLYQFDLAVSFFKITTTSSIAACTLPVLPSCLLHPRSSRGGPWAGRFFNARVAGAA